MKFMTSSSGRKTVSKNERLPAVLEELSLYQGQSSTTSKEKKETGNFPETSVFLFLYMVSLPKHGRMNRDCLENQTCKLRSYSYVLFSVFFNIELNVLRQTATFFNVAPRHEGVLGEWRYSATHSLTSALDGGEWSPSRPGRFTPGKEPLVSI
jgi:hypothetical protein